MDSSPVIFITCNVGESLIGKDSFQEVDITGITMPITKSNFIVRDVNKLADTIREAFAIARSGRPGPVLLDILKNVTAAKTEYEPLPKEQHYSSGRPAQLMKRASDNFQTPSPNEADVEKLIQMINEAKKPLIICGGGVVRSRADKELEEFAKGGFPGCDHSDGRRCSAGQKSVGYRNDRNARIPGLQHGLRQL